MRTTLTILALIGLIGCVTKNYYSIYPTKVERVETKQPEWPYGGGISLTPGIEPGFYKPQNTLEWHIVPGCTLNHLDLRFDTAQVSENYYLLFDQDTTK